MPRAFLGLSPECGQVQKQLCRAARRFATVGTDAQNPACRPPPFRAGQPIWRDGAGLLQGPEGTHAWDTRQREDWICRGGSVGWVGQAHSEGILNTEDGLAADLTDASDVRDEKQRGDEEREEDLKPDESFGNRCSEREGEAGHVQPAVSRRSMPSTF